MQNRYAGDIGDFAKYGLLRALSREKTLGVAWYLYPDEDHNADGKHIQYLEEQKKWEHLDKELFHGLRKIIRHSSREVKAIERSGLLPRATFASERLETEIRTPADRARWRRDWFQRVLAKLKNCDLVFADPDNGLCETARFRPGQRKDWKRLPLDEAHALAAGRPAIFYHHNTRRPGGHDAEIRYWLDAFSGRSFAFKWKHRSTRTFFIINPDEAIEHSLQRFAAVWEDTGELFTP